MTKRISRRDFLNGTQIAIGTSLVTPWSGLLAARDDSFKLGKDYYPPAKTGLRGSHDGSWETMHARVSGKQFPAGAPEEKFDLVVVGAGISGL